MKDIKTDNANNNIAMININIDEGNNIDNSMDSDDDSYKKYCEKIKECDTYDAPYAKSDDIDSDGDDKQFMNVIKRKMEPLSIGDIIKYEPYFDIGNTGKDKEGMVIKVEKRERQIMTSNMDLIDRMGVLERIGCYNASNNVIEPQDGVRRYLKDFKLCDESSEELKRKLTEEARERLHEEYRVSLNNMKQKIKLFNPSMVNFISDKCN